MINGTIGDLDASSGMYARSVLAALSAELGDELIGMYLYGSSMLGDFVPGRSDIDVLAVCKESLTEQRARRIAQALVELPRPAQVKGLDANLVTLAEVSTLNEESWYELRVLTQHQILEVRGGATVPPKLIVFAAHVRSYGLTMHGPPPRKIFGAVPRDAFCRQMLTMLNDEAVDYYRVLNACRYWLYLEEGRLASKIEAGKWAIARGGPEALIRACLSWQETGSGPEPSPALVVEFVAGVRAMMSRAC